jgi:hypothetical protein
MNVKTIKMRILGTEVDIHTDNEGRARVHSQLRRTCGCCGKFVCERRQDPELIRYNHMIAGVESLIASHIELGGKASKQYTAAIEDMVKHCATVAYGKS